MTELHEDKLETLGLDASSHRALLMLPAVYVAWAGGILTAGAATGLEQMMQDLRLGERAVSVVRRWLRDRPTAGYVSHALAELREQASELDEPQVDLRLLEALMRHSEAVARRSLSDSSAAAPWILNRAEAQAIERVSRALGVEYGQTWTDLMRDLGSPMPEPVAAHSVSQNRTKITPDEIRVDGARTLGLADTVPARPGHAGQVEATPAEDERDSRF